MIHCSDSKEMTACNYIVTHFAEFKDSTIILGILGSQLDTPVEASSL